MKSWFCYVSFSGAHVSAKPLWLVNWFTKFDWIINYVNNSWIYQNTSKISKLPNYVIRLRCYYNEQSKTYSRWLLLARANSQYTYIHRTTELRMLHCHILFEGRDWKSTQIRPSKHHWSTTCGWGIHIVDLQKQRFIWYPSIHSRSNVPKLISIERDVYTATHIAAERRAGRTSSGQGHQCISE